MTPRFNDDAYPSSSWSSLAVDAPLLLNFLNDESTIDHATEVIDIDTGTHSSYHEVVAVHADSRLFAASADQQSSVQALAPGSSLMCLSS